METLLKIEFYVPESHLQVVKSAMFAAGAGRVGDYDSCAWQTLGQGQYRPLAGANPFQGDVGNIEQEPEYKVEMVCKEALIQTAISALKSAHPYEEVAFSVIRIESV